MEKLQRQTNKTPKLCLVSSSGGHWEQLKKLQPLLHKYDGFYVSEKTIFKCDAKYVMLQTDLNDKFVIPKMIVNGFKALRIWLKEKPDFVITTGTMVAYPFYIMSRITRKKFVFIETYARASMPTKAGLVMHKHTDLFIVQWESQKKYYTKAVYGGCLY